MTTRLDSRAVPVPDEIATALRGTMERLEDLHTRTVATTELRDRQILEAHAAGGSLREIAALVGLTHAGVADVIRRKS